MSKSGGISRIVRVLTYGKGLEALEPEIVHAISSGCQVLINTAYASDNIRPSPQGDKIAIADWAEALSQRHGFAWQCIGLDILFRQAAAGDASAAS